MPVFDLKDHLMAEIKPAEPVTINESTRTLSGHTNRVTGLSWSKSKFGLLASSSYDGSVQIWDVLNSAPLKNYQGHISRVLSVCWSSCAIKGRKEEQVYSGGEDYSIHSWRPSNVENVSPPTTKPFWEKNIAKSNKNRKINKHFVNATHDPQIYKAAEEVASELMTQNSEESFEVLKNKIVRCYINSLNQDKKDKKELLPKPSCDQSKQKETKSMKTLFRKANNESSKIEARRCTLVDDVLFRIDQKELNLSNRSNQFSDRDMNKKGYTTLYGNRDQLNK